MGFSMRLLDLGGGFSKGLTDAFVAVARAINTALDAHFPAGCGVRIIAEPGRFYAEGAATLAVVVNGVRSQYRTAPGTAKFFLSFSTASHWRHCRHAHHHHATITCATPHMSPHVIQ